MDRPRPRRCQQLVTGLAQVRLDGGSAEVIEHVAFGAQRRTLDDLPGVAREIEQDHARPVARRAARCGPVPEIVELAEGGGIDLLQRATSDERGQQPIVLERRRPFDLRNGPA